ncbi:MAG: hypothetical protein MUF81_02840 [Verrucomicrobia bacterium]|nr:hypothetical protein [Verrucomicrobiota bacterium]
MIAWLHKYSFRTVTIEQLRRVLARANLKIFTLAVRHEKAQEAKQIAGVSKRIAARARVSPFSTSRGDGLNLRKRIACVAGMPA